MAKAVSERSFFNGKVFPRATSICPVRGYCLLASLDKPSTQQQELVTHTHARVECSGAPSHTILST